MAIKIAYEDKLAFVTDFMCKLPGAEQVAIMELAPSELPIKKQVDIIYGHIKEIMERYNPGLRPGESEQVVSNALCAAKPVEKSN